MDILESTYKCLSNWENGGSIECRSLVSGHHSNPHDPDCNAALTTAYHALLSSTLLSWSPKKSLPVDDVIAFVRAVVDHLPSSSAGSERNPNVVAFGEILVDILWAIDSELEEILGDAKGAATAVEQGALSAATVAQAVKAKGNAECDKETLVVMVRRFLGIGILDPTICRERLDLGLVASVGLVADKLAFERKEIRTRTGLFYKQNKFNLLREQSEGYSKLTTELTSSLGPAHSPSNGYPSEPVEAIEARARPTWERTLGLIGYFDLDPNRALDIILDVFSIHLATHHSFFLSLLSFSPWGRRTRHSVKQEDMAIEPDPNQYRGKSLSDVLKVAEERAGYRLDDGGNNAAQVLAQVLGFKFTYYQSPDVTETTPQNLYLMAAILIREGFLSLEDLYPHIGPADECMGDLHKAYLANVETRIAGAKVSQLAMAAPLESGGSSNSKARPAAPEGKKEEVVEKEAPNQKLGLLNALLSVGALRPAISILSKFPWMVDAYPELADLMIRVLKQSIVPLFDTIAPPKDKTASFVKPRARFGATGLVSPPERRPQLTLVAPTPPSTSAVEFVFFFPNWALRIPMCSSYDDLIDVLEPLMRFVGLHVSRDASFLTKLLRVGRKHIIMPLEVDPETKKPIGMPDPTHPITVFWFKVLRMYILPALSLIRGNAVCTVDAWNIMNQFEITRRWQLYGEWKTHTYKSHPELRVRQVQTDRESKGILRRLSHNTIDTLSGAVAKLAYSNPCIFFTNAVNQVMAYDNLAGVVIQALNYVTIMGFDVLVYIILDALANPNKERVKDDGVNISDWLQSLAAFTGMLFRRYSADLTPLLTYVVHQLQNGQTTELVVIRELIWKIAGIEPLPSLSDSQVLAMAGGPTLRIEAVASNTRGARLDPREAKYGALGRLGKSLLDSSLALPLLVQVAQQRQSCVFQAPDAHPKSLASLFDTTHGVLLQYLELLTTPTVITPQDYAVKVVPRLSDLSEKYGICAPICMQIYRPILNATLLAAALAMQEKERVASEEAEKRLKAALTAKREPNAAVSRIASPNPGTESAPNGDAAAPEPKLMVSESLSTDVVMESAEEKGHTPSESPWLPELYPLFEDVKKIAPGPAIEIIGPAFYLTFWQLSTYDLTPPASRYDEECTALRVLSRSEDSKFVVAERSADRAKRSTAPIHKERRNRINDVVSKLGQEFKEQTAARAFTIKRLAREKQHWFAHNPKAIALAGCIIEYCIQPRCLISPMDADFCAQFIKVMHLQGTSGFSTLQTYDKILGEHVKVVIFSCSEYEARNYGRFLLGVLTDIQKWYQDEQLFVQENRTKSGGTVTLLPGLQLRWTSKQVIAPEDLIKWSDFKQAVRKWHRKLCKCLTESIESGEFMHVYNTIIVLKEILPVFPVASVYEFGGSNLSRAIEKFLEKEERGDLKILGRAYFASLKKRETIWQAPSKAIPASRTPIPPSQPERSRNGTPTAPAPSAPSEPRRLAPTSAPSAPKAQLASTVNTASPAPPDRTGTPTSTKLALDSVPRPEVVKRVRPETKSAPDGRAVAEIRTAPKADAMEIDQPIPQSASRDSLALSNAPPKGRSPIPPSLSDNSRSRPPTPSQPAAVRSAASKQIPSSPRGALSNFDAKGQRPEAPQTMPPPSEPSQTLSAQELRETAKQSRVDKNDVPPPTEPRSQAPVPSPRRRSPSPTSRPGTRNPSSESRASGDRRSARGDKPDEKRPEREARQEGREPSRRESTRSERRAAREDREKDGERDRDTRRDRHGERDSRKDRDRDRERDRDEKRERDRERDRDGHRERERERDRDRDRDRHRRDEKDRDRESRKDREPGRGSAAAAAAATANADDRGLPNRPETGGRHRGDESLGKRRRGGDDEADRSSKRSSRKESHHEDRSRRSSEKDGHERGGRDSERRRRDRDGGDAEGKGLSIDTKLGDKRIPEGPASAKALPPSTPSAPRAMTGGDNSRKDGRDRGDWKRDQPPQAAGGSSGGANGSSLEPSTGGSLRSRISAAPGDRDSSRGLPPAPSAASGDRKQDDDRDGGRKRTISDRERDAPEPTGTNEPATQAPKRPRLIRDRYATASSGGLAKKLLPIDPQAADKARAARKD